MIPMCDSTRIIISNRVRFYLVVMIACLPGILTACQSPLLVSRDTTTPTCSATPLPTSTASPTVTPSPSSTATPTHTPTVTPTQTPTSMPTSTPNPTSTITPTNTPLPTSTATPALFLVVDLKRSNENHMVEQLRIEAQKAQELGFKPFAEFTATWCPACQDIAQSLEEQNPLMLDAFKGTYIIRVDVDIWTEFEWEQVGFNLEYIPIFFRLDAEGMPTGDWIDGSAWAENIPENMAPALKLFFQGVE